MAMTKIMKMRQGSTAFIDERNRFLFVATMYWVNCSVTTGVERTGHGSGVVDRVLSALRERWCYPWLAIHRKSYRDTM